MPIYNPTAGGGGTITTKDEGSTLSAAVTTLDFVGAGVTASGAGATTTVTIAGAAGASWTETELDFGAAPGYNDKTFTVTDAGVTGVSKIIIVPSGSTATSRAAGDTQWDNVAYAGLAGTGSFTVYANSASGPINGKRKVYYAVA